MFETRRLSSKVILQVILTIMVLPFLFPLIAAESTSPRRMRISSKTSLAAG